MTGQLQATQAPSVRSALQATSRPQMTTQTVAPAHQALIPPQRGRPAAIRALLGFPPGLHSPTALCPQDSPPASRLPNQVGSQVAPPPTPQDSPLASPRLSPPHSPVRNPLPSLLVSLVVSHPHSLPAHPRTPQASPVASPPDSLRASPQVPQDSRLASLPVSPLDSPLDSPQVNQRKRATPENTL